MDKLALARAVKELARRTDACWRPPGLIQHQFAGSPFGTAYVCISPSEQGDHASANHNRTLICGAEGGLTGEGIAGLRALFETAGVGRLEGVVWPEYLRSLGAPGVHHFMAFEAERPVASAVLCVFEQLGCLSLALTAEPFRRRGAQRALIAKRIAKAMALGCRTIVSETLSILEDSLGNLQNAGFEVIYEKEVYGRSSGRK